jgi:GR25 family glycosyltransferase involved in LPS biosynthesis/esterase/lipase
MNLTITEKEKQTLCLNMIVKDEAHIVCSTFDNLLKYLHFDYYVICDTGSTDGTQKIIKDYFKNADISGEIHECKWMDFGHNRTEALQKAFDKTDYLLIFDADDKIRGDFKLPEKLTEDMYYLQFGNYKRGFVYKRPLLINNRKKFKFEGVLHEYLVQCKGGTTKLIDGEYGVKSMRKGNRSKDPDKYKKDALLLEKAFIDEEKESLKHRYAFYCAQSYKDCGDTENAIKWYKKILTLNNWVQEKYYSALMLGNLYKSKKIVGKALFYWLKTMEYDMDRIEGITYACDEYTQRGMNNMVMILYQNFKNYKENNQNLCNKLFVDKSRYNNILEFQASVSAYYSNKPELGYEICKNFLIDNTQNDHYTKMVLNNFRFYFKYYTDDKVLELFHSVDHIISKYKKREKIHIEIWRFLYNKVKDLLDKEKKRNLHCYYFLKSFNDCSNNEELSVTTNNIKIVNMERREDRKCEMIKKLHENNIENYEFIKAVDGKSLSVTPEINKLFKDNTFKNRCGIIGCALSHYNLWKKLILDPDNEYYIILEDDIEFEKDFSLRLNGIEKSGILLACDCLMLGYSMYEKQRNQVIYIYNNSNAEIMIDVLNRQLYVGGTFGYTINKSGAQKIIDYIEKNGIKYAIDNVMKNIPDLKFLEVRPQVVFTEWYERIEQQVDSDIQKDWSSLPIH